MKLLSSLLLLLLLTSCTSNQETSLQPKFSFGDRVAVMNGFYSGCLGRVVAPHIWGTDIEYDVSLTCKSKDNVYTQTKELLFQESELIEDVSN